MAKIRILLEHKAWYMGLDWIPGVVTVVRHRKELTICFSLDGENYFVTFNAEKRHPGRPEMYPIVPEGSQYLAIASTPLEGGGIQVHMFAIPIEHMAEWDQLLTVQERIVADAAKAF